MRTILGFPSTNLELYIAQLRRYARRHGVVLAVCLVGACSLTPPDEVHMDASGGAGAAGGGTPGGGAAAGGGTLAGGGTSAQKPPGSAGVNSLAGSGEGGMQALGAGGEDNRGGAGEASVATKELGALCAEPTECSSGICGKYQTNVRPGHCCATPTNCNCPGPAFVNLLQNPGFDQDLAGWDVRDNGVTGGSFAWYELEERDMCQHSGQLERRANPETSGYQVQLRQCVAVQEGTAYNFGGSWKSSRLPEPLPDGEPWVAGCVLAFYATVELCEDYEHEAQSRFEGYKTVDFSSATTAIYQWFDFEETLTAPQAAHAAVMDCSGSDDYAPNTSLYFDKFYISPAPSKY